MAVEENIRAQTAQLKVDRKETLERLKILAETNTQLAKDSSDPKERKEALKAASKASKERDRLLKQDLSIGTAVTKEFGNIGTSLLGGFDGMLSQAFGPLGGIAQTLTTGLIRRKIEAKKNLDSDILQEETSKEVANVLEGISDNTGEPDPPTDPPPPDVTPNVVTAIEESNRLLKEGFGLSTPPYLQTIAEANGGEITPAAEGAEGAALGGVAEAPSSGYEDIELGLWTKMEDHLFKMEDHLSFMRSNIETAESRRERLRKQRGGSVIKKGAKGAKGEEGGGGLLSWLGMINIFKHIGTALIAIRAVMKGGLFGKHGLFRTIKVMLSKQIKKIFGKEAMKSFLKFSPKAFLKGGVKLVGGFLGKLSTSILAFAIDGIFGFMDAEKWGVSKTSGVIGGILGGSEGGWLNAAMNAGKWAMLGFQIGKLGGPPGMIAGIIIGAAIGGILGWIGGDVIAKKLDILGSWFADAFHTVFIKPIMTLFDAIVPDWVQRAIGGMTWEDLFPPVLSKLFGGEYFTIDFPSFHWYDIFPKFLVDYFTNMKIEGAKQDFKWIDLLPPFFKKFFAGTYAIGKEEFFWKDLLPPFITKVIDTVSNTWDATDFHWYDVLPNWMVKVATHDYIKPTGTFEWTDLVPTFISKLFLAGEIEGTNPVTGAFEWTRLLPHWMGTAWGSVVSGAETLMAAEFNWTNLLPDWMIGAWASTKGIIKRDVGNFDWTRLLPGFIADLFPGMGPMTINAGLAKMKEFDWMSLLPQFMRDAMEGGKKIAGEMGKMTDVVILMFEDLIDGIMNILPDWARPASAKEKRVEAEKEETEKAAKEAEDLKKAEGARQAQIKSRKEGIAQESAKIKKSEGGSDEYWGSEESGKAKSKEDIEKWTKEIEELEALAPKSKKVATKKQKDAGGMSEQDFVDEVNSMAYEDMPMYARRNVDAGFNPDGSPRISGEGGNRGHELPADELAAQNGGEKDFKPPRRTTDVALALEAEQNGGVKTFEPILDGKHGIPEEEQFIRFLSGMLSKEKGKGRGAKRMTIEDIQLAMQDPEGAPKYLRDSFLATRHQGGPIKQSGTYGLLAGEMVWDQAAVAAFGKLLNQFAMEKVGEGGAAGTAASATVIDSSTQQVITNNTIINSPEPQGPMLPGAGRDHAISHFRHVA